MAPPDIEGFALDGDVGTAWVGLARSRSWPATTYDRGN
jgi:hypothetical protein